MTVAACGSSLSVPLKTCLPSAGGVSLRTPPAPFSVTPPLLTSFQISAPQALCFLIQRVAVSLCLFSRLLKKLLLTVSACFLKFRWEDVCLDLPALPCCWHLPKFILNAEFIKGKFSCTPGPATHCSCLPYF